MAKPENSKESKKRKRLSAGPKGEEPKSNPRKFKKLHSSNVSQKGSGKQSFKPAKDKPSKPHEAKPHFNKDDPAAKKNRRLQAKVQSFCSFFFVCFFSWVFFLKVYIS